jgi:hypothetical protein
MGDVEQRFEVNCRPRSEMSVLGTPKWEIQENVKAFMHAAKDVSERGIASIYLQWAHQIHVKVRKTSSWDGDGLGSQACVAMDLAPLAGQTLVGLGGDVAR